jgi:hypothetical protein
MRLPPARLTEPTAVMRSQLVPILKRINFHQLRLDYHFTAIRTSLPSGCIKRELSQVYDMPEGLKIPSEANDRFGSGVHIPSVQRTSALARRSGPRAHVPDVSKGDLQVQVLSPSPETRSLFMFRRHFVRVVVLTPRRSKSSMRC